VESRKLWPIGQGAQGRALPPRLVGGDSRLRGPRHHGQLGLSYIRPPTKKTDSVHTAIISK
jgi:hypothetical protein